MFGALGKSRAPLPGTVQLNPRWEDVVKEVARSFDTLVGSRTGCRIGLANIQVHVDRYKHIIYKSVKSDPFLFACTTLDPTATRFHACDRFAKCDECIKYDNETKRTLNRDKNIVNVHMVEVKSASWEMDKREYMNQLASAACGEGELPYLLVSSQQSGLFVMAYHSKFPSRDIVHCPNCSS